MNWKSRIRVLHVIGQLDAGGGIETLLMDILRRIDRDRFSGDICYLNAQPGNLAPEVAELGYRMISCRMPYRLVDFFYPFYRLLKREKYDIIHSQLQDLSGPSLLVGHLARVPMRIAHYHSTSLNFRKDWLRVAYMKEMHRWTSKHSTHIIGCARSTLKVHFGEEINNDSRYRILHNGIPLDNYKNKVSNAKVRKEFGIPSDAFVIGHVGHFRKPKNHEGLVRIGSVLVPQDPSIYFLLVGEGELRRHIEAEVEQLGLSEKFIFAGLRRDVGRLMSAMDLFLFPSLWEGFPVALIEAQAAGVPVVASDLPGHRECLAPKMRELFFEPDQVDKATAIIKGLLIDERRYQKYRQAGISFVKQFSIESTVTCLEKLYLDTIAGVGKEK